MFKSLVAAASVLTCCLGNPAMASVGAAFDTSTASPGGGCYSTKGGHTVCWQGLGSNMYTLALRQVNNKPNFATTVFITCGGRWEAYGPADKQALDFLVKAFCSER